MFHLVERYRLSLAEVPVRVENSSRSTVHVVRDALRLVRDLFRIRSWAALGVYDLEPGYEGPLVGPRPRRRTATPGPEAARAGRGGRQ